ILEILGHHRAGARHACLRRPARAARAGEGRAAREARAKTRRARGAARAEESAARAGACGRGAGRRAAAPGDGRRGGATAAARSSGRRRRGVASRLHARQQAEQRHRRVAVRRDRARPAEVHRRGQQRQQGLYTFMVVGETAEFMQATVLGGKTYYALVIPSAGAKRFVIEPVRKNEIGGKEFQGWDRSTRPMPAGAQPQGYNASEAAEKRVRYWQDWSKKTEAQRAELTINAEDGR